MLPSLIAALLCGGKSSRFGSNKALAPVGNTTMIECIARAVKAVVPDLVLVTSTPDEYTFLNLPCITDLKPHAGPLQALLTVFEKIPCEEVLLVACDMPTLDRELIEKLLQHAPETNACVVRDKQRAQYLLARYSRRLLDPLREFADNGGDSFKDFFELHPEHISYLESEKEIPNMNTPGELENFHAL